MAKKIENEISDDGIYHVGEVATQTEEVIVNKGNTEEQYTTITALAKIMNDIEKLKTLLK